VTKPDEEMRLAMMNAEVGDDGYKEDPTVNGKENIIHCEFRKLNLKK